MIYSCYMSGFGTRVALRPLAERCLTLAVPMSSADRHLGWLGGGPASGGGRYAKRAGVGRPAAGAVRLEETGQAAGRSGRHHGYVAVFGVPTSAGHGGWQVQPVMALQQAGEAWSR